MSRHPAGVLAGFRHVDAAAKAIRSLKELGYRDLTAYMPAPNHEIADALGHAVSPVRLWTLFGGLTGAVSGFAMTLWMSYDYPLVVGGKPLGSIPPYVVIAFELTILLGALFTVAGLAFHSWQSHRAAAYDPKFTDDHIGVFVPCPSERQQAVQKLLKDAGAVEVRVEN
jgi:hypothetical protein